MTRTPERWIAGPGKLPMWVVRDPHGNVPGICTVYDHGPDGGTAQANARLIAAAPDLLAACRAALVLASGDIADQISTAIAKAEGGAE